MVGGTLSKEGLNSAVGVMRYRYIEKYVIRDEGMIPLVDYGCLSYENF